MAWKASKTKLVKSKYLIGAIIFGVMVPYLTIFVNTMFRVNEGGKFVAQCLGENATIKMAKVRLVVNGFLIIIFVGSGLFFDIKMLIFVRNRKKIEPIQLIPWKSTNQRLTLEKEKDDITVPLRASCVSTASLIFFGILVPVYVVLVNETGE
jgi:hypothetical protein